MPNWCFNYATLSHADKTMMDKLRDGIKNEKVLESFIPTPKKLLDGEGWYKWRVNNWGTKWDLCDMEIIKDDGETIGLQFNTAWSPPIEAYDKLLEMGFYIEGYYSEGGVGFCGVYSQGIADTYEIDEYSREWLENNIPADIIEACDLMGYIDEDEYEGA